MKILLLSDTHGYWDEFIEKQVALADEIWHAGDFGGNGIFEKLLGSGKPLRGVWGNIDGQELRKELPENNAFSAGGMKVLMTHIGGYPGKYPARVKSIIQAEKPGIYISGHSHILKIIYDKQYGLLHLNPGAAGIEGFHKVRTMLRFSIEDGKPVGMEILEKDRKAGSNPDSNSRNQENDSSF